MAGLVQMLDTYLVNYNSRIHDALMALQKLVLGDGTATKQRLIQVSNELVQTMAMMGVAHVSVSMRLRGHSTCLGSACPSAMLSPICRTSSSRVHRNKKRAIL